MLFLRSQRPSHTVHAGSPINGGRYASPLSLTHSLPPRSFGVCFFSSVAPYTLLHRSLAKNTHVLRAHQQYYFSASVPVGPFGTAMYGNTLRPHGWATFWTTFFFLLTLCNQRLSRSAWSSSYSYFFFLVPPPHDT